ncbi:MAG: SsrA-binding protein [Flavobacteriales bacterium]|jgi:SsrA-binding protein
MAKQAINIKNKRASFEYEFLETFSAGMQLTGTEVKSIRAGKASIGEAYCYIHNGELWIKNMHIAEYSHGNIYNHEPLRERKLLLHGREIQKLESKLKDVGISIVPLRMYFSEKGWVKLDIALGRGKKLHDKRDSIKARDTDRQINRLKNRF